MSHAGDVNELEVEEEDACDPPIDRSVRLYVWIVEHAFDVFRINLDDEIAYSNDP